MTNSQETDVQDDLTPEEAPQATETPPQQPAEPKDDKDEITPQRYKGLQKVVAKKDQQILELQDSVQALSDELEELKVNSASTQTAKSTAEQKVQELQSQLDNLTAERDEVNKQLTQQGIIMKDFPQLAQLAKFIPPAEDEEGFKTNAKEFAEALKGFVDKGVVETLEGASPPSPSTEEEAPTSSEEDRLWSIVYSTSGVPGKEAEYEEANEKLQKILAAKQS